MLQSNVLSHGLRFRHVRRLWSCAQTVLVLAALYGSEVAAEDPLVVAVPHVATAGIDAATPALASAVQAEARPIDARPTLDARQRRMLMMMMIMNGAAQQPRYGAGR
jgi:hypothetical protein